MEDLSDRFSAEDALRESEAFYRQTLESIPGMVFTTRADGYCEYTSQQWIDYTGVPMSELRGHGWKQLLHADDCVGTLAALGDAIAGRTPYDLECRVRRRDGAYEWFRVIGRPILRGGGRQVVRWFGVAINIQRLKETEQALRESEQRLSGIVDSAMDAIISIDEAQRIRHFNPAAEQMFGIPADDAIGMLVTKLIPERFRATHNAHMRAFADSNVTARRVGELGVMTGQRTDGTEFPIEASIAQSSGDGGKLLTAILRDITERRQTEALLRKSQAQLRSFIRFAPISIAMFDRQMNYLAHSDRWLVQYGKGNADLIGLNHYELFPDIPAAWQQAHQRGLDGETLRNDEDSWIRADGSRRWLRWAVQPWNDERGNIGGIIVTAEDITARKRAEERQRASEERLRMALRAASAGVWDWDLDSGRLDGSPESYALYGVAPSKGPQTFDEWIACVHRDDLPRVEQAIDAALFGAAEEFYAEFRVRLPDGQWRWLLGLGRVERDERGAARRLTGINLDITARRQAEEVLREADRRKNEFLATLAHELRNPLAPIRNAVGILRRAASDDAAVGAARDIIDRQVMHMVRLIDDLLDVSRISRGRLQLRVERIELASALEHAVEAAQPHIDSEGHELALTLPRQPIWLDADPVRLAQVFLNLLNNACKYTERGGRIELHAEQLGGAAVVSVRDSGIGIAPADLARVFDLFAQVETAHERARGGIGIGLSLARGLVEMHGGSIEAHSAGPGRGSTFIVRLPALAEFVPVEAPPDAAPETSGPLRVLVADDQEPIVESLAMLLELDGHAVLTAANGQQAFAMAERHRPQVVLLDIGMPVLDGYAACRLVRAQEWGRDMAIIALSGWGQDEDRAKSLEAGFDWHLTKPVDPDELARLLSSWQAGGLRAAREAPR